MSDDGVMSPQRGGAPRRRRRADARALGAGRPGAARARRALDAGGGGPGAHRRAPARARPLARGDPARRRESGRLAFGFVEELLPAHERTHTLEEAAAETGLEPALIERLFLSMGFNADALEQISDDDLELLRHVAAVLSAGFPLVALLQLVRVYGQALAQMADAEVRLFHLYVHEPLMRDGVPGWQMGEEMAELARRAAAAGLADHGPRAPALPDALRRAGRRRAHGGRPRGRAARPRAPARGRSPSPTWPATRA